MKRIYFDNLSKEKFWLLFLILSLVFVLIGLFEPFGIENTGFRKYAPELGFLTLVIYLSRLFWHTNKIQWNKKGIVIRIGYSLGKSLKFNEIKATEMTENVLTIIKKDREEIRIDLSEILISDAQKLNQILSDHISAEN